MAIDPELANLSRTIDPITLGTRIKKARIARGMTQSELASGLASTAYVSRIEAGTRRPELMLLVAFAERCGVGLAELLTGLTRDRLAELELELDYAELEVSAGEANAAMTRLDEAVPDIGASDSDDLMRRVERLRARALESVGRLDEAILLLERLSQRSDSDAPWIRDQIALSRCYRESGDFHRAAVVGETALKTLDDLGLGGGTEAIQLAVTVAAAHIRQGDLGHAMRICLQALADADASASPVAKASAYWNASAVQARRGQTAMALDMAKRALQLMELGDDVRNLARLRVDVAEMYLQQQEPNGAAAMELLARAEQEMAWSSASEIDQADLLLVRARAGLAIGDLEVADVLALRSLELVAGKAPIVEAGAAAVRGRVAARLGAMDGAAQLYRDAVHTLSGAGADRDAAQLWFELGELLSDAGDPVTAGEAFRRAAASTGLVDPARTARIQR